MFGLSFTHLMLLFVLALIVIGPEQLPELARTIGRFINEIKRSTNEISSEVRRSVNIEQEKIHKPEPTAEVKTESTPKDENKNG